jgi:hypothetical protein
VQRLKIFTDALPDAAFGTYQQSIIVCDQQTKGADLR